MKKKKENDKKKYGNEENRERSTVDPRNSNLKESSWECFHFFFFFFRGKLSYSLVIHAI